jgi:hypothetical protein
MAQDDLVLVDTIALAMALGVKPMLVKAWASRGKLSRHGQDQRLRTLYSLAEGYKVQAAMYRRRQQAPV